MTCGLRGMKLARALRCAELPKQQGTHTKDPENVQHDDVGVAPGAASSGDGQRVRGAGCFEEQRERSRKDGEGDLRLLKMTGTAC